MLSRPDRLALAFIAGFAIITLALHPAPGRHIALLALIAASVVGVAASQRNPTGRRVHAFFPIAIVVALFESIGPIIAVANPARYDATLARADAACCGSLAEMWRNVLGRPTWLTDLASLAYVSFYFLPIVVAVVLYRRRRSAEFELFATVMVATFLASYVGYLLWPALGPRVPEEHENEVLGGGLTSVAVRALLRSVEGNQLDAFPSGHAAIAMATLCQAWTKMRSARPALLVVVAAILFSTVYLSLHYIVDLIAGAVLGTMVSAAVVAHERFTTRRQERARLAL